jgi:hypothetical protein
MPDMNTYLETMLEIEGRKSTTVTGACASVAKLLILSDGMDIWIMSWGEALTTDVGAVTTSDGSAQSFIG